MTREQLLKDRAPDPDALLGWAKPGTARTFHVFRAADRRALCGKWSALGIPADAFTPATPGDDVSNHDCQGCARKLKARASE